jgi:hypothetical protein
MPNDNDISLLRAAGQEDAAKLLEAARIGEAQALTAASAATRPEIGTVADPATAEAIAKGKPAPGTSTLQTLDDVEALSDAEFSARFDEVQAVMRASGR